jgi:hypothetical protein
LTAVFGEVSRRLLSQAVQARLAAFLASNAEASYKEGRRRLVPQRISPRAQVPIGIGAVMVRVPRMRDRGVAGNGAPFCFT